MTKSEAGRLGGLATHHRHGSAHMRKIGLRGAETFWRKYTVQPLGTSAWAIVERATNKMVAQIGNLPPGVHFEKKEA